LLAAFQRPGPDCLALSIAAYKHLNGHLEKEAAERLGSKGMVSSTASWDRTARSL
jgi:hypothetical protein